MLLPRKSGRWIVVLAIFASAVPTAIMAMPKELSGHAARLMVSSTPDRSHPTPLDGKTLYGRIHVFLAGVTTGRVSFYLDDPSLRGTPRHSATRPPFDFVGTSAGGRARPFDTTRLSAGKHTIIAVVRRPSAPPLLVHATFRIERWYVSPSGSDNSHCTDTSPCRSFSRAFTVVPSGGAVEVASGYYGCEEIRGTKSADVTFVAASGASPTTTCEQYISATHIAFTGVDFDGLRMAQTASYVTLRNVNVTCQDQAPYTLWDGKCSAGIFGAPSHFLMQGGSVGPTYDNASTSPGNSQIGIPYGGGPYEARNILFDGVRFHDNRIAHLGIHSECLMLGGGKGVTIRNSRFDHCSIFDVFVTWWNFVSPQYPMPSNILLENNWFFDTLDHNYSILFSDHITQYTNVTVRYNSFTGGLGITNVAKTNFNVIANVGPLAGYECAAAVNYAYNVWDRAKCGPTDRGAPSNYVDPGGYNLRLKPDAVAINHGDPKNFPRHDIFGQRRPKGKRPDAGAVETR
jgi:hypothetical protein